VSGVSDLRPGDTTVASVFRWGRWNIPATAEGVHRIGVVPFIALRFVAIFQLIVATTSGPLQTLSPTVYWAAAVVFVVEGVVASWWMLARRSPVLPRLAVVDVGTMSVLLLAQILYAPSDTRLSTWEAWGFGVSLSSLTIAGIAFSRWWQSIAAAAALAASYLASVGPSAWEMGHPASAISNATGYLANVVVIRLIWSVLLRLAIEADRARAEAARLARQNERTQQRDILHDPASILRLLADPDALTPELRGAARRQALVMERKIRSFLAEGDQPARDQPSTVADVLRVAAADFTDLDVTVNADLADGVYLPADVRRALLNAVTTLLHNVRTHAGASRCVVHGDVDESGWEVVVTDDGVGFTPGTTPRGYGLDHQVIEALRRVGADVDVWSSPGLGTTVTIAGRLTTKPVV
jgi:signal transduction histidine kinase